MTREAILSLASEAAHSAWDAHGVEMPGPATAYDFICQMRLADENFDPTETDMWLKTGEWPIFRAEYWRIASDLMYSEARRLALEAIGAKKGVRP